MRLIYLLLVCAITSGISYGGVTIHYTASVSSSASVEGVLNAARVFAEKKGWKVEAASGKVGVLHREDGEKEREYSGPVYGICVKVAARCEPLFLQFGDDLVMHDFVKTQFAGPEAHIGVVELFEAIRPQLKTLEVLDEGEYWGTNDRKALLRNLEAVDVMMAQIKKDHPEVKGPIFLPNGRVIDIAR